MKKVLNPLAGWWEASAPASASRAGTLSSPSSSSPCSIHLPLRWRWSTGSPRAPSCARVLMRLDAHRPGTSVRDASPGVSLGGAEKEVCLWGGADAATFRIGKRKGTASHPHLS
eukprot:CAMPEP_0198236520 /NCGR_PEP_ID=MMETSP1446-20131203/2395_1 /TAXON_ID=1461542 ORGANISM="Unidentified sp, Strain CCMP2111" /NCGR_SAMPLE_ID=MMETSP1446 /ASSEMBLY_ACC=CAM_ASM_001112 /LENGTH=113 /DNA_ID=CAMNT_0043918289 /DNA_START=901 /DNA_END=1242 /DNA_ORIENTATION=+